MHYVDRKITLLFKEKGRLKDINVYKLLIDTSIVMENGLGFISVLKRTEAVTRFEN